MKNILKTLSILAVVLIFAGPAQAQETTDQESGKRKHRLEELTVTAQKREEDPQKVPMALDALSDLAVEDSMIATSMDLTRLAPNVHMKDTPYENVIVIRGVSSFSSSLTSPAAYYVNGVGYALHYMHDNELLDVERIEILKGPQGTLYGRNSESGVINIITKQPGNEFRAKLLAEYGNYNSYRTMGAISGPVVKDQLYLGLATQYKYTDGYCTNLYDDDDQSANKSHFNGRATLRWTPTHQWDISLIADMVDNNDRVGCYHFAVGGHPTDPFEVNHDEDERFDEQGNTQVLNVNYKTEAFRITSVTSTAYRTYTKNNDADNWVDETNSLYNEYTNADRLYSQELRISSPDQGAFQWLAGLYGFHEQTDLDILNMNRTTDTKRSHFITDIETQGFAVFGQATYTLLDILHATVGLRYDYQDLSGENVNKVSGLELQEDLEFNEFLPKFSLSCDIAPGVMAYATVARGYLAGGYNWCQNPRETTFTYEPEYSWNYETGLKTTWLNNKLMANLSLFYITIDDKQVSIVEPETKLNTIANAAKAYSYGLEVQLKAQPVAGLEIFANFGFNQAKFDEFMSSGWNSSYTEVVTQDMSGNYLPFAPEITYNAGIQYRAANGFMARADLYGTGKFYADPANTAEQEGYELVNLKVGHEGKNWDVYFWVKNLFDQEYTTWMSTSGSVIYALDGPPRTFGVTVAYRF